jgi:hypothetical protein
MAEIINLRRARKRADRRHKEERANTARVSHGISKAERGLVETQNTKVERELDGHHIDTGEAE